MTGRPGASDCRTVYEVTVAGSLGPALRAAFAGHHVATQEPSTVIRLHGSSEADLAEVIGRLASARVPVREVRRMRHRHGDAGE